MKPSELLTPEDIEKINRTLERPARPLQATGTRIRALLCPFMGGIFYNVKHRDVPVHRVKFDTSYMGLRPTVSERNPAVALRESLPMSIGRGDENDVRLDEYGYCHFVTKKHAIIFYDRYSNNFELLNYSEFGTKVNSVFYSVNVPPTMEPQEMVKKPKIHPSPTGGLPKQQVKVPCACGLNPSIGPLAKTKNPEDGGVGPNEQGWESSAMLTHGCVIKFGCRTFVFSILD